MTIIDVGNDSNRANAKYVQVQFVCNIAGISYQNLLTSQKIGVRHEKVPVLDPPTELSIDTDNQTDLTSSTGVVQAQQALKTPVMEEVIVVTTLYNTGANRTPWRVSSTGIDGTTPATSSSAIIDVDSCLSPTPTSGRIWNGSIENIRQTNTPNFRNYS